MQTQTDFLTSSPVTTRSKKQELWDWCKRAKVFSSVHVRMWGINNFYSCSDRIVRYLVAEGFIRRLPDEEIKQRGLRLKGQAPLAWYEA